MKTAAAGMTVLWLLMVGGLGAQPRTGAAEPAQRLQVQPAPVDLNAVLLQIQQATSSANADIGKLRIEKWKTDSEQKKQLLQIADSVQKNITNAVPGLINDVQTSKGSVLTSFKLYDNLNILYEFFSGLADAAGSLGKREEYEPLAADATALDTARRNLSTYIEQTIGKLEAASRTPAQTRPSTAAPAPGKKVIVIDDEDEPAPKKKKKSSTKSTKKKTSTPAANAPAQTSATPQATPH
jgi:hypothetical protein